MNTTAEEDKAKLDARMEKYFKHSRQRLELMGKACTLSLQSIPPAELIGKSKTLISIVGNEVRNEESKQLPSSLSKPKIRLTTVSSPLPAPASIPMTANSIATTTTTTKTMTMAVTSLQSAEKIEASLIPTKRKYRKRVQPQDPASSQIKPKRKKKIVVENAASKVQSLTSIFPQQNEVPKVGVVEPSVIVPAQTTAKVETEGISFYNKAISEGGREVADMVFGDEANGPADEPDSGLDVLGPEC